MHSHRRRAVRQFLILLPLVLGCFCLLFGRGLTDLVQPAYSAEGPALLAALPAADSQLAAEYHFEAPSPSPSPSPAPAPAVTGESARGQGVTILNKTDYTVDVQSLLAEPLNLPLQADAPQILIIHTHGSESYAPEGVDTYTASDPSRTEDTQYNMIRVGDELAEALAMQGFQVIHDRNLYDYPSYNGSYTRTLEAIQGYLAENPSIQLVLDIHRDAVLLDDGSYYKTTVDLGGETSSQVMLCVGTDASGLEHPNWRENLKLALHLQEALCQIHPDLARPITLVSSRYNQHLSLGSLIVEVGYNGNSLQEALAAVRAFASAAGSVCQELF